jgi:hypothetical protein
VAGCDEPNYGRMGDLLYLFIYILSSHIIHFRITLENIFRNYRCPFRKGAEIYNLAAGADYCDQAPPAIFLICKNLKIHFTISFVNEYRYVNL